MLLANARETGSSEVLSGGVEGGADQPGVALVDRWESCHGRGEVMPVCPGTRRCLGEDD